MTETTAAPTAIPVLRFGQEYESLQLVDVRDHRTGRVLARVGQANAGLIRRDLRRVQERSKPLRELSTERLIAIFADAGERFLHGSLPLGPGGEPQSPDDFVAALSATSGLPHTLCRANMRKIYRVFTEMPAILRGLTH